VSPTPVDVVFDTDIGTNVDDALALALALASPEINLVAVTVTGGDTPTLHTRARIAARLLGLAGRSDVPVLLGHPNTLRPGKGKRQSTYGHEGEGLLDHPQDGTDAPISDTPAVDWLTAQSRQRSIHVVATGPLTTIAAALQRDPALARRLRHLSVMGGFVHPENASPHWQQALNDSTARGEELDSNTAADPHAALICATSGVPITWVTIEITLRTAMTRAALERLRTANTPFLDALCRLTDIWSERFFHHRDHGLPDAAACYHDPLAMSTLLDGPWLTLRKEPLTYAVEDGLFRIRVDAKDGDNPRAAAAHVSVEVNSQAFEVMYLSRLLAAFAP
jgi:purine nucleosidase